MLDSTDSFLVERGGVSYQVDSENLMAYLEDTDYMLVSRSDVSYKVSGADVRASLAVGNPLSPALPPFGGKSTTETVLDSADGKVEFSLDGVSYSTNLTVPINTFYYVDWGSDILLAAHGADYAAQITATYTDLGVANAVDFEISQIDKLPDPFSFTALTEVPSTTELFSDIVSPLETINAPTQIWVTSDAAAFQIRVGDGTWFNPPTLPGSAYVSPNQEIQVRHTTGTEATTAYTTTVFVGHGTNFGEFESADFVTTTLSSVISTPGLISPEANADVDINSITVTGSAIAGQNYGTHQATTWQVAEDPGFNTIFEESIADTVNLTSYTTSVAANDTERTLYVRFKYIGSTGTESEFSPTVAVSAKQMYTFRITLRADAGNGGRGGDGEYDNDGGQGREIIVNLETIAAYLPTSPPSTVILERSAGSGGSGQSGGGNGAAAARARVDGVVVGVGGGGGGGSVEGRGGDGGAPQSSNSSVSNGQAGTTFEAAGGGAGTPGGAGGGRSAPGGGGGSYYPEIGTVINNTWTVSGRTTNLRNSSGVGITVERKYKDGSYTQVGSFGDNFNNTVASIVS